MLPPYLWGISAAPYMGVSFIFPSCEIASLLYKHQRCSTNYESLTM